MYRVSLSLKGTWADSVPYGRIGETTLSKQTRSSGSWTRSTACECKTAERNCTVSSLRMCALCCCYLCDDYLTNARSEARRSIAPDIRQQARHTGFNVLCGDPRRACQEIGLIPLTDEPNRHWSCCLSSRISGRSYLAVLSRAKTSWKGWTGS